jgi:hypothetical protein
LRNAVPAQLIRVARAVEGLAVPVAATIAAPAGGSSQLAMCASRGDASRGTTTRIAPIPCSAAAQNVAATASGSPSRYTAKRAATSATRMPKPMRWPPKVSPTALNSRTASSISELVVVNKVIVLQ